MVHHVWQAARISDFLVQLSHWVVTMQAMGWLHKLLEELKRRRVIRVATLYVVATWPIIQIAYILSPAMDLPASAMRLLLFIFITGFPVALILAWLFNLNSSGISRDTGPNAEITESEQKLIGSNTELLIVAALLLVAAVLFVIQGNVTVFTDLTTTSGDSSNEKVLTTEIQSNIQSIAVLPFRSFSKD